jgi:putative tryptophan/tyrosine transport system substrate-binding protein
MRRREFITLVGGAAAAWPFTAHAQQALPLVGFLSGGSPDAVFASYASGLKAGLAESGYTDGKNVSIVSRWSEGQNDRLPALASDLVRAQVSVMVAGGPPAALAAKAATSTIPIVFTSGGDPIKLGLVSSINRPGGHITGVAALIEELGAKRLGLLRDLVPGATLFAAMLNPTEPAFQTQLRDMQEAARAVGLQVHILSASTEREIDDAFATAGTLPEPFTANSVPKRH